MRDQAARPWTDPSCTSSDLHDYGSDCNCTWTQQRRQAHWAEWEAERETYRASPEGRAKTARRQAEEGEVIARDDTDAEGYGTTPLQRGRFIVAVIRTQLRRKACTVHTADRDRVELLLSRPMEWCPACGSRT